MTDRIINFFILLLWPPVYALVRGLCIADYIHPGDKIAEYFECAAITIIGIILFSAFILGTPSIGIVPIWAGLLCGMAYSLMGRNIADKWFFEGR